MPLLPAELFFYSFPGEIDCPNPECANSLTCRRDKLGEFINPTLNTVFPANPLSINNHGADSDTNPNNLSSFAGSSTNNSIV